MVVFTTEQVTKTSACHNIIILFSDLHLLHSTYIKLSTVTLQKTIRPIPNGLATIKTCSCYFEILMRIGRNHGSAAVNVFDTKYYEICDQYQDYCKLYTDGSMSGDQVGSATICGTTTKTVRVPNGVSIFRAELYAITMALNFNIISSYSLILCIVCKL